LDFKEAVKSAPKVHPSKKKMKTLSYQFIDGWLICKHGLFEITNWLICKHGWFVLQSWHIMFKKNPVLVIGFR